MLAVAVDPLRALGSRLAAQVEALGDTAVLSDEQERAALDALEKAGILPAIRSMSATMSTSAVAVPVAVQSGPVVDRQRMQWSPAPPSDCEGLTLLATDDGTVVLDAEIPVPRSAG